MKFNFVFLYVIIFFANKINSQDYNYKDFESKTTIKEIVEFIQVNTDWVDLMSFGKFDTLRIDKIETAKSFDFENFNPIKRKEDDIKSQVQYSVYKSKDEIVRIIKTNLDSGENLYYTVLHTKGYKIFFASQSQPHLTMDAPENIMGFFVHFEKSRKCIFVETKIPFIGQYSEKIHTREISSIMTLNADLDVDNILFFSDSKLACLGKVNIDTNGLYLEALFYSDKNLYLNESNCSQYGDLERLKIGKLWHLAYRYEYHCSSFLKAELTLNNNRLDIWKEGLSIGNVPRSR